MTGPRYVHVTPGDGPEELGLAGLVSRLVDDAKDVARTEIAVYKARAAERASAYKGAVVFFAAAGVLALCGLIALLVGLILTLATLVGPGFATLIVVVAVFAVAGALAWIGKGRLAVPPEVAEATK